MRWISRLLFISLFLSGAVPAMAKPISITPELFSQAGEVEQALQSRKGFAKTEIEGIGARVTITYSSNEPLDVYMMTISDRGKLVPTDTMHFLLPAGDRSEATIDLTVSPSWSLSHRYYVMNLLSKGERTDASFYDITFEPATLWDRLAVPFRQFFRPEPFLPSTYHALHGYRVLAASASVILGILAIVAVLTLALVRRKAALPSIIGVCVLGMMIYSLRFSVDVLRFTHEHLTEWVSERTYDEAESIYQVADTLNALGTENPRVFICRDGTNFKEKLLRYFVYPIPVSEEAPFAERASHVLLMDKLKWEVTEQNGKTILRCGDLDLFVTEKKEFHDSSLLFRLAS